MITPSSLVVTVMSYVVDKVLYSINFGVLNSNRKIYLSKNVFENVLNRKSIFFLLVLLEKHN